MNGSNIFIDTNICIYLLNGDANLADLLDNQNLFVSFITEIDLYSAKSMTGADREVLSDFLQSVTIIDINDKIKHQTIELRQSGVLKLPDSIIAASALVLNYPFISADKAFGNVEALELILYKK